MDPLARDEQLELRGRDAACAHQVLGGAHELPADAAAPVLRDHGDEAEVGGGRVEPLHARAPDRPVREGGDEHPAAADRLGDRRRGRPHRAVDPQSRLAGGVGAVDHAHDVGHEDLVARGGGGEQLDARRHVVILPGGQG
jgi:hypothetical protein